MSKPQINMTSDQYQKHYGHGAPKNTPAVELQPGDKLPARERQYIEDKMQRDYKDWFDKRYPQYLLIHIPNEGKRKIKEGANLKKKGMTSGAPDNIICVQSKGWPGCWIELKTETGSVSKNQKAVQAKLRAAGYLVYNARSLQEAQTLTINYLEPGRLVVKPKEVK